MCCLKAIATTSLDTGALQVDFENAICSGSLKVNAPLDSLPPSTLSVASPAVEVTVAVVLVSEVRSTPGAKAPKEAGGPSASDNVGGTVPPTGVVALVCGAVTTI